MNLCRVCHKNPATVPDRAKMGRPINRLCSACHAERLVEDLRRVLEVEKRKREQTL